MDAKLKVHPKCNHNFEGLRSEGSPEQAGMGLSQNPKRLLHILLKCRQVPSPSKFWGSHCCLPLPLKGVEPRALGLGCYNVPVWKPLFYGFNFHFESVRFKSWTNWAKGNRQWKRTWFFQFSGKELSFPVNIDNTELELLMVHSVWYTHNILPHPSTHGLRPPPTLRHATKYKAALNFSSSFYRT